MSLSPTRQNILEKVTRVTMPVCVVTIMHLFFFGSEKIQLYCSNMKIYLENVKSQGFFKILFIFLERAGRRRDKERERNINVQEKHQQVTSCMLPTGGLACNLTGNHTDNPSVRRPALTH